MKFQAQKGFTLTELLVVVAIAAVGVALAVPQIQSSIAGYNLVASTEMLVAELDAARMMAISRGADFQISFTSQSIQIIDPSDPENPVRAVKDLGDGVFFTFMPDDPIVFSPRGFAQGGVFQVANRHGETFVIQVTRSGRTEIHQPSEGYETSLTGGQVPYEPYDPYGGQ